MRLIRVNPIRENSLYCCKCKTYSPSRSTFADLEGTPFQSYYCDLCVVGDPELLKAVEYSGHLAEVHAGETLKTCPKP